MKNTATVISLTIAGLLLIPAGPLTILYVQWLRYNYPLPAIDKSPIAATLWKVYVVTLLVSLSLNFAFFSIFRGNQKARQFFIVLLDVMLAVIAGIWLSCSGNILVLIGYFAFTAAAYMFYATSRFAVAKGLPRSLTAI